MELKDCEWCLLKKGGKKKVPQTLQWDYYNWQGVRISWKGWTGVVLVLSLPHRIGRFRNLLGWVVQGWVEVSASSQKYRPSFLLPIITRCAQTCFKNFDPLPCLAFQPKWAIGAAAHTHQIWLRTERNTIVFKDRQAHNHGPAEAL